MRLRQGARVLLLDEQDRLLLFKVQDATVVNPAHPIPETFWVTIGGGLEPGESFDDAARREVFEESGIDTFELGAWVWEREQVVDWGGNLTPRPPLQQSGRGGALILASAPCLGSPLPLRRERGRG